MAKYIKLSVIFIIPLILLCGCGKEESFTMQEAVVAIEGGSGSDIYQFTISSSGTLNATSGSMGDTVKSKKLSHSDMQEIDDLITAVKNSGRENIKFAVLDGPFIGATIDGKAYMSLYENAEGNPSEYVDIHLQELAYKLMKVSPVKVKGLDKPY